MARHAVLPLLIGALGAALVVHAQVQAPPPIPKGPNVLLGRALDMSADAPIGGAIVTLIRQGFEGRSIMTTADGYFVFRDLPAGRFNVAVRALGYADINTSQVIEITDNEKPSPIPVRLWKHGSISGQVVDDRGDPVIGMHVNALRRSTLAGSAVMSRVGTGVTDDRGIYRITQLPPGDYVVGVLSTTTTMPANVAGAMDSSAANREAYMEMSAALRPGGFFRTWGCPDCWASSSDGQRHGTLVLQRLGPPMPLSPEGKPLGFANSLHPGTASLGEATLITLESGDSRTGVNIPIRFVPAVSVSGVVNGPDGPMKHMVVRLVPPGVSMNDFDPSGIAIAVTDVRGAFTLLGVTSGEYTLSAAFAEADEMTGTGRSLTAIQQLAVGDTDIAGLILTMQPGARVAGRVEFKSASSNRPTQRMQVVMFPVSPVFARTFGAVVQPDSTFRSIGGPPGTYTINASAGQGWFWQSTTLAGRLLTDEIIELGTSEVTGLVVTFAQATNGVSGTVTDANGAPDPGATVIAFAADATAAWRNGIFTNRRVRVVSATSKGAYEIATLAPGEYYVTAVNTRQMFYWRDQQLLERLIAGATKVTLGVEDTKSVALRSVPPPGR